MSEPNIKIVKPVERDNAGEMKNPSLVTLEKNQKLLSLTKAKIDNLKASGYFERETINKKVIEYIYSLTSSSIISL